MKTKVGLWIDRRKAVLVFIDGEDVNKKLILSDADKQQGRIDGVRSLLPSEAERVPMENRKQRDYLKHLNIYYDNVISNIRYAESILIFGPGFAKFELLRRIKKNKISGQIDNIETAGKMSDNQIESKVKRHLLFNESSMNWCYNNRYIPSGQLFEINVNC